jgi:hypothetical protein
VSANANLLPRAAEPGGLDKTVVTRSGNATYLVEIVRARQQTTWLIVADTATPASSSRRTDRHATSQAVDKGAGRYCIRIRGPRHQRKAGSVDEARFNLEVALFLLQWRPFAGAPLGDAGWKVPVDVQSSYYQKLTTAQKERAATRGFRSTALADAHEGTGFVVADPGMHARRWDIGISRSGQGGWNVLAADSVAPWSGTPHAFSEARTPLLQLIYEPGTRTARLSADSRVVIRDYRGHKQFIENYGFMFGAMNSAGSPPRGEMDYFLAMLEIR